MNERGAIYGKRRDGSEFPAEVNDLLTYAESGKPGELPVESVDAGAGLKTVIDESGAVITSGELPRLATRSVHLRQLLQNLITNAIKYKSAAKPLVHIAAERVGSEWIFSVKDNGIGISPEYQDKIFGLFKRLHSAPEYSGTGLGLALCSNIVGLYAGRIWVESEPGKGATFYFSLPQ